MDPTSSTDALQRWQETGDPEALDRLLQNEIALLRERIRRDGGQLLSSSVSAGDVAQEIAIRLLERRDHVDFETPAALRAYLWQAAWRLLVDRVRRRGRRVLTADVTALVDERTSETSAAGSAAREDERTALLVSMNLLNATDQEVLDAVYLRGQSIDETAARIGIDPDAVAMRLVRARRNLAKKLASWSQLLG